MPMLFLRLTLFFHPILHWFWLVGGSIAVIFVLLRYYCKVFQHVCSTSYEMLLFFKGACPAGSVPASVRVLKLVLCMKSAAFRSVETACADVVDRDDSAIQYSQIFQFLRRTSY